MSELGYSFRPDGNFLVSITCEQCGERFDVHAMANAYRYPGMVVLCEACQQVEKWIAEGLERLR